MIGKRVDSLRKLFTELGIDGYVIPSNDKYMSEYVPEYAKRLQYITGFTGSNGIALICKNRAVLFTDGRYLEQAVKELDNKIFQIFDLKDISLFPWQDILISPVSENSRQEEPSVLSPLEYIIGYDPELFTYPTLSRIFSSLKSSLQKINGNLVDKIWENQPSEPNSKIYQHDIKYAGEHHLEKIRKCREMLIYSSLSFSQEDANCALIISDPSSICWLLNLRANDVAYSPLMFSKIILTTTQLYLFIDPLRIEKEIITEHPEITVLPETDFEIILKQYPQILADNSLLSVHIMDLITDKKVQNIADPCQLLKACKNNTEIKHAINFHTKDALALCEFFAELDQFNHLPITEYDLAKKLTYYRSMQEGYVMDSFPTICGFKENSAIIHYQATKENAKKIQGDGILLIDSGAQYWGCTTDITRTLAIGEPTPEQKKCYTQVLKGHIALSNIRFPKGTTGSNLDVLARQYLWQDKVDYPHGTGHGVGSFLSVHEGPQSINLRNKIILQPGMILSNEPGFYMPGAYGIRIENLMYVRENDGWLEFETLSLVPYDYSLIAYDLLNNEERHYIANYYQKIKSEIYASLSENAKNWLDRQINFFLYMCYYN